MCIFQSYEGCPVNNGRISYSWNAKCFGAKNNMLRVREEVHVMLTAVL